MNTPPMPASDLSPAVSLIANARNFVLPLIASHTLDTGENTLAHADAVVAILNLVDASENLQAACYLVYACEHLSKPEDVIGKSFGVSLAQLAIEATKLVRVQRQARTAHASAQIVEDPKLQVETVRKMLLAFSRDLRVVLLRLASRLQTLRYYAASREAVPPSVARESLHVFAPLANRLGIWQIKWELEDLAFRFLEPDTYQAVAKQLDEKRAERELSMTALRKKLEEQLRQQGLDASVQGRPKHIYSIVKKMRGKSLEFDQIFDVRALRVIVPTVADSYAALSYVHSHFEPLTHEFDDYIARPKANGYQSLHTVVRDASNRPIEIQIRTQAMHDHAETGVAAHWAYKEAGTKGYAGVSASSDYDAKIAVLRQLLAWERDVTKHEASAQPIPSAPAAQGLFEDNIYVLTPDAAVVELPQGATAVDFAYSVHTSLGHRCRGAKVDGVMVPLNTPLQNGQTVEINTVKEGGPSRDWLNPDLGYLASHRARAKVRAWFNAQVTHETIARGREAVEKLLQREGKTALKHEDLASQLGFSGADDLFEVVGKDELSLRTIETLLRPPEPERNTDDFLIARYQERSPQRTSSTSGGNVLVVGVDSLLTQLAKCCKPAPPDLIGGFVTRGKGVSIHRSHCSNFKELAARTPGRVIDVAWRSDTSAERKTIAAEATYPVDLSVEALDRQGLLRDISEVFSKEKINVIGVQTQSVKGTAWMTFTVEISDAARLGKVLGLVTDVQGVRVARRR